jgi:N-acetylglucosaminyl-diphospho-decaprenol L-rhamnosyltransferase
MNTVSGVSGPAPDVSVVVVSWNTRELLRACLRSLEPEVDAGRAEVCVVDNGSGDGSPAMVAEEFPRARLVANPGNDGFGAAVNRGAAAARGRWIAVANADVELELGALEALLAAGAADPGAGALAPRLLLPDGRTQHSVFAFPTVPFTLALNLGAGRVSRAFADRHVLLKQWDHDRPRRVPWAIAAFLLVRREAWEQAGGFDDAQWMYAEDLDLGWRLREAGWATRYVPEARVRHHSAASTTQAFGDAAVERWQRSTYAWMLRRRGPVRTRAVAAINVAGCWLRRAALAPAARVQPLRWGWVRDDLREWQRLHAQGLAPADELREHR